MWKGRLWIIITLCLSYCLLKKISHDPIDKRKNRLMEYKPLHQRFNCQIKKRKEKHTYNDIRRSEKKRAIITQSNWRIGRKRSIDPSSNTIKHVFSQTSSLIARRATRARTPLISKKRGSTAISLTRTPEGEKGQKKSLVYIIVQR